MDDGIRLPAIVCVILLLGAVYFAVAETAFASSSRARMKAAADRGEPGASQAMYILDHIDSAITSILIGTNLCHLFISSLVTVVVTRRWGISAVSVATIVTTLVVFFAGEMLPKSVAKKFPERLARACAGSLRAVMTVFYPLSSVLTKIGQAAANRTQGEPEVSVTEDELYDIIEDMTEEGSLDEEQGELISSALQFGDITVERVVTPRMDVVAIDVSMTGEEILEEIKAQNHSRLPVYEGDIDHVIGILQIRKFIKAWLKNGEATDVRGLLDEAFFIHQSTSLDELLSMLSKRRINMAVVTDNFGGTLGIVTVEDIVEEIVGEIWDEDDEVRETIVDLSDNACIVDADESVADVFDHLGYEDPEEHDELVDTRMGEWAYEMFDTIPKVGDSFSYHALRVTVSQMDHKRIMKLEVVRVPDSGEEAEQG
ncbi:MAG: HlyC/CorC family transporter [Oscillospiraceae bacterium]|nr:HlyC/CorC family transporter [Oscillospiraceae bacterium]